MKHESRSKVQVGRKRLARAGSAVSLLALLIAAGCSEEVGGDGFVPARPAGGNAGSTSFPGGGEGGEVTTPIAGKGGTSGSSGTGGKGGRGGTSSGGTSSGGTGGTPVGDGGDGGGPANASAVCGNMMVEEGEQCDDGNTQSGDGCTADCKSDCEVCEKTFCKAVRSVDGELAPNFSSPPDPFASCFLVDKSLVAQRGNAQGEPRADLCRAVVDCVRRESCAQLTAAATSPYTFRHCLCAAETSYSGCSTNADYYDPASPANLLGKCASEFIDASEYDTGVEAFTKGPTNAGKAMGAANLLLLTCDRSLCTEECLPKDSQGVVAQIKADILATKNELGESALGNLIADSQRAATGTDFALVQDDTFAASGVPLAAGLLFKASPGRPADADGRVLHSEVRHVLFGMELGTSSTNLASGTALTTLQLTGKQLFDYLALSVTPGNPFVQVSGLSLVLGNSKALSQVLSAGKPIDPNATFSITVSDFIKIPGAANVVKTAKTPEQALIDYLKNAPQPVAAPALDRITLGG